MHTKGHVVAKIPGQNQVQIRYLVSYETLTVTVDKEMFDRINEGGIVTFIELMGKIMVLESKDSKE